MTIRRSIILAAALLVGAAPLASARSSAEHGDGRSLYVGKVPLETTKSGDVFQLKDPTRGNISTWDAWNQDCRTTGCSGQAPTLFTDTDNHWADDATAERAAAAVDAQYDSAMVWDFYKNVFGRLGPDGRGKGWANRVHVGRQLLLATWDPECYCIDFGDGDGRRGPFTTLDVTARMVTFVVTSNTAGLGYEGEPGALNEATSDIMAAAVEFYANNPFDPADYLIGERNFPESPDPSVVRFMDRPSRDGQSPDAWSPDVGKMDPRFSSGVADHFFFLLAEGSGKKFINGVSYDSPTSNGSTIKGIGIDAATKIWYTALTEEMQFRTDYADARRATLAAAGALFGRDSVQYATVAAAWSAVNVK
ncbi:hypothetical protein GCM10022254_22180 [Actinomadura meridiana]|uniref:Uncharacterized protein n=1 Tax=Actinomadura meridiana TaxID=559626 RepID=A0ABP8BXJ0_9ACTN